MVERNGERILARLAAEGWVRLDAGGGHVLLARDGRLLLLPEGPRVFAIGTAHAIGVAAGWIGAEG